MVKKNQNWSELQDSPVILPGQSRFDLTSDSKEVYIWRESGMQNLPFEHYGIRTIQ